MVGSPRAMPRGIDVDPCRRVEAQSHRQGRSPGAPERAQGGHTGVVGEVEVQCVVEQVAAAAASARTAVHVGGPVTRTDIAAFDDPHRLQLRYQAQGRHDGGGAAVGAGLVTL